ncbi:methyltransferase domain-containing protein [Nonomuraea monospora]|uniref:Protein-L-isoaspartate O-methyltransferase n=1 Tax=Nonomuraea monospora TaxID=568818 RepID=A0ABN3CZ22_9ACTN
MPIASLLEGATSSVKRFEDGPGAWALAERLADELVKSGDISDPAWREAFASVPRHVLVPHFAYLVDTPQGSRYDLVSSLDPDQHAEWLNGVYANETLLTQVEGRPVEEIFAGGSGFGRHSSSSTQPGLMAWMLETADLREGQRVLEIGTGTGYNAALLSRRLGAGQVTSIDIDAQLTGRARERLATIGLHPTIVTADGRAGYAPNALYDRVLATCGLGYVPPAWIEQTRSGGLILTNVTGGLGGAMLLARVGEGNIAQGRFMERWAGFMPSRHTTAHEESFADTSTVTRTRIDPDLLGDAAFAFLAQLYLPQARRYWTTDLDGQDASGVKTPDGSWARVAEQPDADGSRRVEMGGRRRLWDRVEEAHAVWENEGRPGWVHFAFEASPDGQTVSLGDRRWQIPMEEIA